MHLAIAHNHVVKMAFLKGLPLEEAICIRYECCLLIGGHGVAVHTQWRRLPHTERADRTDQRGVRLRGDRESSHTLPHNLTRV